MEAWNKALISTQTHDAYRLSAWVAGSRLLTALNGSLWYQTDCCNVQTVLLGAVCSHVRARPAARQSFIYKWGASIYFCLTGLECSYDPLKGHPGQLAYTLWFVSYRHLSPKFQSSLSAVTLAPHLCGVILPLTCRVHIKHTGFQAFSAISVHKSQYFTFLKLESEIRKKQPWKKWKVLRLTSKIIIGSYKKNYLREKKPA